MIVERIERPNAQPIIQPSRSKLERQAANEPDPNLYSINAGLGRRAAHITQEQLRQLLSYDSGTGAFHWKVRAGRAPTGKLAGTRHNKGYLSICVNKARYLAHRLAWLYTFGAWPVGEIDHINGDREDNRIANLRDVSRSMNQQNRRCPQRDNALGVLGVTADGARFVARMKVNGKSVHLGQFGTAEKAHEAYVEAKRRMHPGCTL